MKTTMSKFFTSLEALFGAFLGAALSFISPIAPFFWLAIGLVVLDTVTGIIAARKRKEKINSRGFARLLSKIVVYMASIMACRGVEQVLHVPNVTYLAVGAIALTELMSVLENTRVVSGANVAGVVGGLLSKFQKVPEQDEEKKK
jgi:phage-related holin